MAPTPKIWSSAVPVLRTLCVHRSGGPGLKNIVYIDNQTVMHIVSKQTSKSSEIRKLVLNTLLFNIIFKAQYINTKSNDIADSISRCQWHRFRNLAPQADPEATPLPWLFGVFDRGNQ